MRTGQMPSPLVRKMQNNRVAAGIAGLCDFNIDTSRAAWPVGVSPCTGRQEDHCHSVHAPCKTRSPGQIMIPIAKPRATRLRSQYQIKLCLQDGGLRGAASTLSQERHSSHRWDSAGRSPGR